MRKGPTHPRVHLHVMKIKEGSNASICVHMCLVCGVHGTYIVCVFACVFVGPCVCKHVKCACCVWYI